MIGAPTVANAMDEKDELPARAAPGDGTKGRTAFVQNEPVIEERLDHVLEFRKIYRLCEKGGGAELVGFADIAQVIAGAENHGAKLGQSRLGTNPTQDLEPIHARHFQVEEQEVGQRKLTALMKLAFTGEIVDSFFAIPHVLYCPCVPKVLKGAAQEEEVAMIILGDQNDWLFLVLLQRAP